MRRHRHTPGEWLHAFLIGFIAFGLAGVAVVIIGGIIAALFGD